MDMGAASGVSGLVWMYINSHSSLGNVRGDIDNIFLGFLEIGDRVTCCLLSFISSSSFWLLNYLFSSFRPALLCHSSNPTVVVNH